MRDALGGESLLTDGGERNRHVGWLRAARRRKVVEDIEDVGEKVARKLCVDFLFRDALQVRSDFCRGPVFQSGGLQLPVGAVGLRNRRNYQQIGMFVFAFNCSLIYSPITVTLSVGSFIYSTTQTSSLSRLFKAGNLGVGFLSCDWSGFRRAEIGLKAASGPPLTPGFLTNNTWRQQPCDSWLR